MELKLVPVCIRHVNAASSNRTFMELKPLKSLSGILSGMGSNRTFMELKQESSELETKGEVVLIVPLWN